MATMQKPHPVLLADGRILAPQRDDDTGHWNVVPVRPESEAFVGWLRRVQTDDRYERKRAVHRGIWRFAIQWTLLWLAIYVVVLAIWVVVLGKALDFLGG